jgi:diguanylate cyclase (GGDEF)-like protein
MFAYLRDVLYHSKDANLDPEQLDELFRDLAQGMLFIGQCVNESRALANELARGNLESTITISPGNDIASGLKNLQSTLKHISWQVKQVAKGDYHQKVSFAGTFSESINDMIEQLKERDRALHAEIETNQRLAADAHNTVLLLESITKGIEELIVVIDCSTYEWLYTNHEPSRFLPNLESVNELKAILNMKLEDYNREPTAADDGETPVPAREKAPLQDLVELMGEDGSLCQFFSVMGYPITWMGRASTVLVLVDVTAEQREREQLEQVAFYDTLTSAYSRHYGMLTFERWLIEKQSFVVAFVDMDGLKYVNDTLGHTIGDEYILSTARILTGFGEQTILCRLGGDEFMLLIRGFSIEQAREVLEEMRERLAANFDGAYNRSFSYGLVEIDEENTRSASLLLSIADECMYDDKRGRKKERRAEA